MWQNPQETEDLEDEAQKLFCFARTLKKDAWGITFLVQYESVW